MANYGGRGHARREELARAKGFASYGAYRKASREAQQRATAALARRDETYRRSGAAVQSAQPQRRSRRLQADMGAGGQVIVSMVDRELRAFLRRAGRDENRIYGRMVVRIDTDQELVPKSQRPRVEFALWQKGGVDPGWLLDLADALGSVRAAITQQIEAAAGNTTQGGSGAGMVAEDEWTLVEIQLLAK